jgi:threonine/homoserine/homoserine lactone efflux protein
LTATAIGAWVVVALLGVMTPGIDTVLVLRHTLLGGARGGLAVVTGIAGGCLVWATATLAGLTALLAASEMAYGTVRIAGALYLLYLGVTTLWRTLPRSRAGSTRGTQDVDQEAMNGEKPHSLRAGFLTNLLNPKVGVFYISLLPQFLPTGDASALWGGLLVAIHLAATYVWYPILILIATRARGLLMRDAVRKWMERTTATVLIAVGIRLALE